MKASLKVTDWLKRSMMLLLQLVLAVLRRPISFRILLALPAILWFIWPKLNKLGTRHFSLIGHCNPGFANFIVAVISAAGISALLAPLIRLNRVTLELGLFQSATTDRLE